MKQFSVFSKFWFKKVMDGVVTPSNKEEIEFLSYEWGGDLDW